MALVAGDIDALKLELKTLVGWQRGDGSGCYCSAKIFTPGQTWTMMLGYLHKDRDKVHFNKRYKNIDLDEVERGIILWKSVKLSYEDDKILITKANMFHRLFTYKSSANPESVGGFVEEMTEMLNTKKYMYATGMVTNGGVLRLEACDAMWKLIQGQMMTEDDVKAILFPPAFKPYRPGGAVAGQRYFDPTTSPNRSTVHTPVRVGQGFLASDLPRPIPPATREGLTSFTRNMLSQGWQIDARPNPGAASSSRDNGRALGAESPHSEGAEEPYESDFIDDDPAVGEEDPAALYA